MDDKILHVDGDCFFASCEVARRPDLRGKPVVVGEERGIACAMTIEAKQLGITRAKPIFEIRREFPDVIILPSHFELYEMYSEKLYRILKNHLLSVERYSIDECFALMPLSYAKKHGSFEQALFCLKHDVEEQLGITFSFGLADTKVLSKIASKCQKPNGCTYLRNEHVRSVLSDTEIGDVWGIGRRLAKRFRAMGIRTALQFMTMSLPTIESHFPEPVSMMWHELRGERMYDISVHSSPQKSLQATRSFAPASCDKEFVFSELSRNVEIICRRLRDQKLMTRNVSLFLKQKSLAGNIYKTASKELSYHTQNPSDILREFRKIYDDLFDPLQLYRATGITVWNLASSRSVQWDLFGFQQSKDENSAHLRAVDVVSNMFGYGVLGLASSLRSASLRKKEQDSRNKKDSYIWNLPLPYLGEVE